MQVTSNELNSKHKLHKTLNHQIQFSKADLKSILSYLDFIFMSSLVEKLINREKITISRTHERKLIALGITNNLNSLDHSKVISTIPVKN